MGRNRKPKNAITEAPATVVPKETAQYSDEIMNMTEDQIYNYVRAGNPLPEAPRQLGSRQNAKDMLNYDGISPTTQRILDGQDSDRVQSMNFVNASFRNPRWFASTNLEEIIGNYNRLLETDLVLPAIRKYHEFQQIFTEDPRARGAGGGDANSSALQFTRSWIGNFVKEWSKGPLKRYLRGIRAGDRERLEIEISKYVQQRIEELRANEADPVKMMQIALAAPALFQSTQELFRAQGWRYPDSVVQNQRARKEDIIRRAKDLNEKQMLESARAETYGTQAIEALLRYGFNYPVDQRSAERALRSAAH